MKKILVFLLASLFVLSFASCQKRAVTPPAAFVPFGAYPRQDHMAETPTGVLYFRDHALRYYNKLTGENEIFCFDPLCEHRYPDCLAYKFFSMESDRLQSIEYCDANRRFYALRGEQIYSFAFDGSELTHVVSMGENGKFENDDDNSRGSYKTYGLGMLEILGQYLYFFGRDAETGDRILYRHDTASGKTELLFPDINMSINGYHVSEKGLYISFAGENGGFYRANTDGTGLVRVRDVMESYCVNDVFDGERMYFLRTQTAADGDIRAIVEYDPEADAYRELFKITDELYYSPVAVNEDYLYISSRALAGASTGTYPILRIDLESGDAVRVFEEEGYAASGLYLLDDQAVVWATYENILQPFLCDIDENGCFTAPVAFK